MRRCFDHDRSIPIVLWDMEARAAASGQGVALGPGERGGRPFAERLAIISCEVTEVAKAASEGDRCHRCFQIRRRKLFPGVPEADHPGKSHRRVSAALLESLEYCPCPDPGRL